MLETADITFYLYEKHFVSLNNLAILNREDFFLRNYVYARNNIYKLSTALIPADCSRAAARRKGCGCSCCLASRLECCATSGSFLFQSRPDTENVRRPIKGKDHATH